MITIQCDEQFANKIISGKKMKTLRKFKTEWLGATMREALVVSGTKTIKVMIMEACPIPQIMRKYHITNKQELIKQLYKHEGFDTEEEMEQYLEQYTAKLYGKTNIEKFMKEGYCISWIQLPY